MLGIGKQRIWQYSNLQLIVLVF